MGIRDDDYRAVPTVSCGGAFTAPPVPTFWRETQYENNFRT